MKKIIFINLLIFIFLLVGLNFFIKTNIDSKYGKIEKVQNWIIEKLHLDYSGNIEVDISEYEIEESLVKKIEMNDSSIQRFCGEDRKLNGIERNYSNNPIVMLGCSYAYGHGLKREESFSHLLSGLTKRPIYSFASCGGQISGSYDDFESYIENLEEKHLDILQSDYVIYVYMYDHISRYIHGKFFYSNYEELFEQKFIERNFVRIPLFRYIMSIYRIRCILKNYPDSLESSKILKKIILKTQQKLKEKLPNAKMLIIIYDEKIPNWHSNTHIKYSVDIMNSKMWTELEAETEIKVIRTKDIMGFLFDKEYKLKEDIADWHPNARAWKEFTPKFASQYIK